MSKEAVPPKFDDVLAVATLAGRAPSQAIDFIGSSVDRAWAAQTSDALRHLVALADTVDRSTASDCDVTHLDYYLANAWNGVKCLKGPYKSGGWEWDSTELENEIISVRRAIRSQGFGELPAVRRCQLMTNLGNCHSTTGRFIEAVAAWDGALAIEPRFGMAIGNRAVGRWSYAKALYDQGHIAVMAHTAWHDLEPSRLLGLEDGAGKHFAEQRRAIEAALGTEILKRPIDLGSFSLGATEAEVAYRQWCLRHRLFLNPLNDLGPHPVAARDILTAPAIVAPIGEGPRFHGFFNQIKQEFCSARWLAYESASSDEPHFADSGVLLYNTLDYPCYSVAAEKLKLSFRSAYSLLDKIAFFLNAYLGLGIPEKRVSMRGMWFEGQQKTKGLRPEFGSLANWPLRGLYWLGKDLFEEDPQFRSVMAPDAERLNEIRNHLEHKYLRLHLDLWPGPPTAAAHAALVDDLAESVLRGDFEAMTLRLLRLVRSAIIYLSLGVHQEERARRRKRPAGAITPPMFLDAWEDEWKR